MPSLTSSPIWCTSVQLAPEGSVPLSPSPNLRFKCSFKSALESLIRARRDFGDQFGFINKETKAHTICPTHFLQNMVFISWFLLKTNTHSVAVRIPSVKIQNWKRETRLPPCGVNREEGFIQRIVRTEEIMRSKFSLTRTVMTSFCNCHCDSLNEIYKNVKFSLGDVQRSWLSH